MYLVISLIWIVHMCWKSWACPARRIIRVCHPNKFTNICRLPIIQFAVSLFILVFEVFFCHILMDNWRICVLSFYIFCILLWKPTLACLVVSSWHSVYNSYQCVQVCSNICISTICLVLRTSLCYGWGIYFKSCKERSNPFLIVFVVFHICWRHEIAYV